MILKLQNTIYVDHPWVLIDKVHEIRIHGDGQFKLEKCTNDGKVEDSRREDFHGEYVPMDKEGNLYFPDKRYYKNDLEQGDICTYVQVIYTDKSEESIAFIGIAFLLNDDGKTIERI